MMHRQPRTCVRPAGIRGSSERARHFPPSSLRGVGTRLVSLRGRWWGVGRGCGADRGGEEGRHGRLVHDPDRRSVRASRGAGIREDYIPACGSSSSRTNATTATIKILNENRAGQNQSDVFDGTTTVVPLKRAGYVLQWLPDAAKNYPPQYKDQDGYWIATNLYVLTPAFNTKLVPPGTEPQAHSQALLDPKWRGKMVWARLAVEFGRDRVSSAPCSTRWARTKGMAYLKQLRAAAHRRASILGAPGARSGDRRRISRSRCRSSTITR